MSRKHYDAMANVVSTARAIASAESLSADETLNLITVRFGAIFRDDNPNFNMTRWINACDYVTVEFPPIGKGE